MKRRSLFLALHVTFLTSTLSAQLPELDTYIENARKQWECPGIAVAVVRDGKVLMTKGYGVRTLGRPELVDENTMFDTASLSKSFTAAAIATLVDQGKMRWDDPVRKHLPTLEFPDAYRSANVTVRDLLAHRIGLEPANFMMRMTNYPTEEVLRRVRFLEERDPFRSTFTYFNIGYAIAGEAAAAAAKMSFADLVRTSLVEPLGMRDTTVAVDHARASNHASSHARIDGVHQPIRTRKRMNIQGANAVNSTAKDMARWLLFNLGDGTWEGKKILTPEALAEMHSPHSIIPTTPAMRAARGVHFFGGYGLGWQVMDYRGHKMLWHSGNADCMPVYMAILPNEKIGVLVMTNSWEAGTLHGMIAGRILDTLLGDVPLKDSAAEGLEGFRNAAKRAVEEREAVEKARITGTKPSRPLDAYAGTYVDTMHGDMVVKHENGRLTLTFGGGEQADLEHWHHDVFSVRWHDRAYEWADTFIAFALDASGTPKRFEMKLYRDLIEAVRR